MQLKQACTDFLSGYFSTHDRSTKTKNAYTCDLAQFEQFAGSQTDVASLGSTAIEDWAAHLRTARYSPTSVRRKIVVLKVFFGYWVRKGTLQESPFWRVKLSLGKVNQLPRALTEREMKALLVQASRTHSRAFPQIEESSLVRTANGSRAPYRAIRNLALVDILFATGMRVGEVSALNVADFLVDEAMFKIKGKGGRARVGFAVDEKSLRIQKDHLQSRLQETTESSALFLNSLGNRLSTQGITNVIAKTRRDAGIERHVTPHMLRHTVATLLLRNGVDIRVVQEFLGHASIATTQRYTHITKEHLIEVLKTSHPSINLRLEGASAAQSGTGHD